MEIYSLRSIASLLYKNENKSPREQMAQPPASSILRNNSFSEQFEEVVSAYKSITPRQLRERAQQSFEIGAIDQDTYRQLASELPMEAIDQQGRVLDLSSITEDTPFNFQDYYRNQLQIALNMGDRDTAGVLQAAVDFLES